MHLPHAMNGLSKLILTWMDKLYCVLASCSHVVSYKSFGETWKWTQHVQPKRVFGTQFPSPRWGNVAESVEGFAKVTDAGSAARSSGVVNRSRGFVARTGVRTTRWSDRTAFNCCSSSVATGMNNTFSRAYFDIPSADAMLTPELYSHGVTTQKQ